MVFPFFFYNFCFYSNTIHQFEAMELMGDCGGLHPLCWPKVASPSVGVQASCHYCKGMLMSSLGLTFLCLLQHSVQTGLKRGILHDEYFDVLHFKSLLMLIL